MKRVTTRLFAVAALVAVSIAGCDESSSGVPIHGSVNFKGARVANATLMFYPDQGRAVTTTANEAGEYSVQMPPGSYTVTVVIGATLPPGWKEGDPIPPPKIALPAQYATRAKTTLRATVKPTQAEPTDFELK
jgi:hypothetical protein